MKLPHCRLCNDDHLLTQPHKLGNAPLSEWVSVHLKPIPMPQPSIALRDAIKTVALAISGHDVTKIPETCNENQVPVTKKRGRPPKAGGGMTNAERAAAHRARKQLDGQGVK